MKNLLLLIFALLMFIACKKEKNEPAQASNNSSTTAPSSLATHSGLGSNINNIHGVMQAQKFTVPSFSVTDYESGAAFSTNAMPFNSYYMMGSIYTTTGVNAGVLKLNTITLKYDLTTPYQMNRYVDTITDRNYSGGVSWNLTANTGFSSFTTTVTRGFPVITKTNYLPASISKSAGLTLNIGSGNYSNTDSLIVFIAGNSQGTPLKHLAGTATSVVFNASELSGLTTGSGNIVVFGINYSNVTVSGKNYICIMEHNLSDNVVINP